MFNNFCLSRTAEYLDCSIQFVYQMIGTGELKAVKLEHKLSVFQFHQLMNI